MNSRLFEGRAGTSSPPGVRDYTRFGKPFLNKQKAVSQLHQIPPSSLSPCLNLIFGYFSHSPERPQGSRTKSPGGLIRFSCLTAVPGSRAEEWMTRLVLEKGPRAISSHQWPHPRPKSGARGCPGTPNLVHERVRASASGTPGRLTGRRNSRCSCAMSSRYLFKEPGTAIAAAAVRLRGLCGPAPFSTQEPSFRWGRAEDRKRKLGQKCTGLTASWDRDGVRTECVWVGGWGIECRARSCRSQRPRCLELPP